MSDTKCPCCGFSNHIEEPNFCQECGVSLTNYCTNDMCPFNNGDYIPIPFNAKFCPECGSESTFNSLGYFENK
ncbi:hypothetical protein PMY12_05935 [Clostridium tertium]|uniref:hypothetical protein n=1 Tax=Clostridium TaxID=1485 RepID=UPI00232F5C28|nr:MULTISPECIES: hypothetical protein [Clostridium]MDB1936548.1 hypothetical protein [Clostridium tertium]MDU7243222.1 hypothetical protein [Clostridium sp.]